jgi:hypothetical protein
MGRPAIAPGRSGVVAARLAIRCSAGYDHAPTATGTFVF